MLLRCCCDRRWGFQQRRNPGRRAPVTVVELLGIAIDGVIAGRTAGWAQVVSRAARGASRVRILVAHFVREEAAFDERYNIRLHPTQGARSRVPLVPALRVYSDSAWRG